jgi:hypothetical protein
MGIDFSSPGPVIPTFHLSTPFLSESVNLIPHTRSIASSRASSESNFSTRTLAPFLRSFRTLFVRVFGRLRCHLDQGDRRTNDIVHEG